MGTSTASSASGVTSAFSTSYTSVNDNTINVNNVTVISDTDIIISVNITATDSMTTGAINKNTQCFSRFSSKMPDP